MWAKLTCTHLRLRWTGYNQREQVPAGRGGPFLVSTLWGKVMYNKLCTDSILRSPSNIYKIHENRHYVPKKEVPQTWYEVQKKAIQTCTASFVSWQWRQLNLGHGKAYLYQHTWKHKKFRTEKSLFNFMYIPRFLPFIGFCSEAAVTNKLQWVTRIHLGSAL